MKKLILFAFLLALSAGLMAQRSGSTTTLLPQQTYKVLTMTAADTVHVGTTPYWIFATSKNKLQYFSFAVELDTTGATDNHIYVDVKGSIDGTTWVASNATQVKYGASVDTTFSLNDVSTGCIWRYLKLQFAAQGATVCSGSLVKAISVRVVEK
jgi:hypothetical protein